MKRKNQKAKQDIRVVVKPSVPVFRYTSTCCKERAHKQPLVKTEKADGTLGTFRCTKCNKPCKCTRSLNREVVNQKSLTGHLTVEKM